MPRNLVLFDLEWNIGYQPYTFNYHGVQQTFRFRSLARRL
jgi:hypothetical protein